VDEQRNGKEASRRTGRARVRHEREDGRPPTSAQLRDEMPSARTVGRSSARDPAAAPMDTDDEAAGHAPQGVALQHEHEPQERSGYEQKQQERTARITGDPHAPAPDETDDRRDAAARSQSWAALIVVLGLVLGCVALWLAMR
jgi:hypothetical protein